LNPSRENALEFERYTMLNGNDELNIENIKKDQIDFRDETLSRWAGCTCR